MGIEVIQWEGHRLLWVDSSKIRQCMEIYRRDRIQGIGLSPHKGYKLSNLAFLKDYPEVIGVAVPYAEKIDLGDLSRLRDLRYLSISGSRQKLDLDIFEKLEELRVEWHPKLHMPPKFTSLRKLLLRGYKSKLRIFHRFLRFRT